MKKILVITTIMLMLVVFTVVSSNTVFAALESDSTIKIDTITYDILGNQEGTEIPGVSFDKDTTTLTLDSVTVDEITINKMDALILEFKGENNIKNIVIKESDSVRFNGDGKVIMSNQNIADAYIMVSGTDLQINVDMEFPDTASENICAISAAQNHLNISSNISIEKIGTAFHATSIIANDATIEAKEVDKLFDGEFSVGIESSNITCEKVTNYLLVSNQGSIYMEGSIVSCESLSDYGFYADGRVEMNNSTVTLVSDETESCIIEGTNVNVIETSLSIADAGEKANAICASNTLAIDASDLSIEGSKRGIVAGEIAVLDSEIEIHDITEGMEVGMFNAVNSQIEIALNEGSGLYGIMCEEFETSDAEINIEGGMFGIASTGKINVGKGYIEILSSSAAIVAMSDKQGKNITIAEGMITVPFCEEYSVKDDGMYASVLGYGKLVIDNSTQTIKNAATNIVIREGKTYKVKTGAKQTYTISKGGTLNFVIESESDVLKNVYINETLVPSTEYTVSADNTSISISEKYAKKLAVNTYYITFEYADGMAGTTFNVVKSPKDNTPGTGSRSYDSLLIGISLMSLAGIVLVTKKQEN